jgi:predicted nucleic acid-binding protein
MVVVFNSSPWIFLSKLGIIELAIDLFSEVFLPLSVNEEVLGRQDEASSALERLQRTGRVKLIKARNSRLVKALGRRLGKGEKIGESFPSVERAKIDQSAIHKL